MQALIRCPRCGSELVRPYHDPHDGDYDSKCLECGLKFNSRNLEVID